MYDNMDPTYWDELNEHEKNELTRDWEVENALDIDCEEECRMIIGIRAKFDSSHHLPLYEGKCANIHGHTWHLIVEVEGQINEYGFVMDFTELKRYVNEVIELYDHKVLNDFVFNPTCENLVEAIHTYLNECLPHHLAIAKVELREGEGGYAYKIG